MSVNMNIAPMGMSPAASMPEAASPSAARDEKASLTVTSSGKPVLDAASGIGDVPESALRRDDALGRLVSAAFAFPPPAMPGLPAID